MVINMIILMILQLSTMGSHPMTKQNRKNQKLFYPIEKQGINLQEVSPIANARFIFHSLAIPVPSG